MDSPTDPVRFLWRDHPLELLASRTVWDPGQRLLLLADLHLGKAETLQAMGIALPSDGDAGTLNRLLQVAHVLRPERVVVLGDLIHGRMGLTVPLRQKLTALPQLLGCRLQLIAGNHDRGGWLEGLSQEPPQAAGPLWLSHEPMPRTNHLNLCGHLHPVAVVGRGTDRLRLPCFAYDRSCQQLQLPSFGLLTGGHPCSEEHQRWIVVDDQVVPWPQAGVRAVSPGPPGPAPHRPG